MISNNFLEASKVKNLELEKLMELFANLCSGRNYHNSNEVKALFPHKEIIQHIYSNQSLK